MRMPAVILVRPRFPENIGMAARACANMGVDELMLVAPERWDKEKALPLATPQGAALLETVRIVPSLEAALAPFSRAYGATARTGGRRGNVMTPAKAAAEIAALPEDSGTTALVFGPEDRGLENTEIERCTRLITIPTAPSACSLNLAQAVLLVVYECFRASLPHAFHPAGKPRGKTASRPSTLEEQELLFAALRDVLVRIDFFSAGNPDWFMLPLRRFFQRSELQRHEFDLFMGIFRRIRHAEGRTGAQAEQRATRN